MKQTAKRALMRQSEEREVILFFFAPLASSRFNREMS